MTKMDQDFWHKIEGDYEINVDSPQPKKTTNKVSILNNASGQKFVLKSFLSARALKRERHALMSWTPSLSFPCPSVILWTEGDRPALLMSHLSGQVPDIRDSTFVDVSRCAGMALRELHALDIPDVDDMSLHEALGFRFEEALRQAQNWLSHDLSLLIMSGRDQVKDLPHRSRVPCHGDYVGRNWLVQSAGNLAILDFEHARLNVCEADFLKLHMEVWPSNESAKGAFFEAYDKKWDEDTALWVTTLEILYLVGSVNWHLAKGQEHQASRMQTKLRRLRPK